MNKKTFLFAISLFLAVSVFAQRKTQFNGINTNLSNLQKLSDAKSRSISAENFTGAKGQGGKAVLADSIYPNKANSAHPARNLGQGWKLNPLISVKPGDTFTLADIDGPGAIKHIWMTPNGNWRLAILRIYWENEKEPAVEVPLGDFFCMGLNQYASVSSLPVTVNPGRAFNCFWNMPFRKHCKITIENLNPTNLALFYQIDYVLAKVPKEDAYFHAQFRYANPDTSSVYTIADIHAKGQYVGVYMTWKQNYPGWWGEGEIKFYMDGDKKFPTINGTGVEDYFLGSYGWLINGKTETYSKPYAGVVQEIQPDSLNKLNFPLYGLYRWHIRDPIRFNKDIKITIQDLGWKGPGTFKKLHSDITSVVFWYQKEPSHPVLKLPSKEVLMSLYAK